jgi:alanine racemase
VDRVAASIEADELLRQMDANLRQQEQEVSNCAHAVNYAVPVVDMVRLRVILYPLAPNGHSSMLA